MGKIFRKISTFIYTTQIKACITPFVEVYKYARDRPTASKIDWLTRNWLQSIMASVLLRLFRHRSIKPHAAFGRFNSNQTLRTSLSGCYIGHLAVITLHSKESPKDQSRSFIIPNRVSVSDLVTTLFFFDWVVRKGYGKIEREKVK